MTLTTASWVSQGRIYGSAPGRRKTKSLGSRADYPGDVRQTRPRQPAQNRPARPLQPAQPARHSPAGRGSRGGPRVSDPQPPNPSSPRPPQAGAPFRNQPQVLAAALKDGLS